MACRIDRRRWVIGHDRDPHPVGKVAKLSPCANLPLGPTRSQLIGKGMIWSPTHGDTAFTVPLFDEFMRRIIPGNDWQA